ncbi:glycosyltransferase family 4 protein [Candidatus Micrarchaeota archaeon]|nr:glycosyltransferase family 4 protein [Candidatus Micrarchaeota archaeon]
MKVLQLGNVCNLSFNYAKYLRQAGVDCELMVSSDPSDVELPPEDQRHFWVKYWRPQNPAKTLYTLWKNTRKYDVIHAHGGRVVYAQLLGKPFIAQPVGSDLRLFAQENTLLGFLLRRAYASCDHLLFSQPDQVGLFEKMGLDAEFVFQIIDTETYSPRSVARADPRLTIFYPTRHSWVTKGNDKFFRAFAEFLKTHPDAQLFAVDWDIHKERSKALVSELGIGRNVTFLNWLSQAEMLSWYRKADFLADEFNIGSFGLVALEAMSCGKPVLRYIDEKLGERFYGEKPPIANAHTQEEILAGLLALADPAYREKMGERARKFVLKHHQWQPITRQLIQAYEGLT